MNAQKLPEYFMVSDCDGGLYDTRKPDWSKAPLRANYRGGRREIKTFSDLKASLRQKYAWPGGYEIVYHCSDGGLLCHDCVKKNIRSVWYAIHAELSDGWRIVGSSIEAVSAECAREHSEDLISFCDHCSKEFGELS